MITPKGYSIGGEHAATDGRQATPDLMGEYLSANAKLLNGAPNSVETVDTIEVSDAKAIALNGLAKANEVRDTLPQALPELPREFLLQHTHELSTALQQSIVSPRQLQLMPKPNSDRPVKLTITAEDTLELNGKSITLLPRQIFILNMLLLNHPNVSFRGVIVEAGLQPNADVKNANTTFKYDFRDTDNR